MITHLKPIHGTEFRCDTRGKQFTGTHHLIAHLKPIHGKRFICDIRGKQFTETPHPNAHLKSIHGTKSANQLFKYKSYILISNLFIPKFKNNISKKVTYLKINN